MGFILALALCLQRWLLWCLFGSVMYWVSVEVVYKLLLSWLPLSDWNSYVAAMGVCWLPLFSWIVYRLLRYNQVSYRPQRQHELNADNHVSRYIEHTPVYDADFQPRFR